MKEHDEEFLLALGHAEKELNETFGADWCEKHPGAFAIHVQTRCLLEAMHQIRLAIDRNTNQL